MGWIKERILTEYAKYGDRLDWARLAEAKINLSIRARISEINTYNAMDKDDCILIKDLEDALYTKGEKDDTA